MQITFYTNIDFDRNYEHVMRFANQTLKDEYFGDRVYNGLENLTIRDINIGYEDIVVDIPFNDMANVKYFSIDNNGKKYYCWVDEIKPYSPEQSTIIYSIDYMMTYEFEYSLETSFVEREHEDRLKIVNNVIVRDFANKKMEDVDYGTHYVLEQLNEIHFDTSYKFDYNDYTRIYWAIVYWTEDDNVVNVGHVNSHMPGFAYNTYIIPLAIQSDPQTYVSFSTTELRVNANGTYHTAMDEMIFSWFLLRDPHVISVKILPYCPFKDFSVNINTPIGDLTHSTIQYTMYSKDVISKSIDIDVLGETKQYSVYVPMRQGNNNMYINMTTTNYIPAIPTITATQYNQLKNIDIESKLLINPYRFYRLSYLNQSLEFYFDRLKAPSNTKFRCDIGLVGNSNLSIGIESYDDDITHGLIYDYYILQDGKLNIPMANFNIPIRTSNWLDYYYNNQATIHSGALINTGTAIAQTGVAMAGGPYSMGNVLSSAVSTISNILQQDAKYKDIQQSPTKMNSLGDDYSYYWNDSIIYPFIEVLSIPENAKNKLYNYMYMFGYKANVVKKPNLTSRYYFNFIKTTSANIKTNTIYGEQIKAVFDKGVTFWHYRNKSTFKGVYNYDYENIEMSLI